MLYLYSTIRVKVITHNREARKVQIGTLSQ